MLHEKKCCLQWHTILFLFTILAVGFLSTPPHAMSYSWSNLTDFKGIDGYNLFLSGNLTYYKSDVEGRVAVKGDVKLNNFSIGLEAADSQFSLVAGGDIVAGDIDGIIGGGSVNNGGIFSSGKVDLAHTAVNGDLYACGDVHINETSVAGNLKSCGSVTRENSSVTGTEQETLSNLDPPIDFDDISLSEIEEAILNYSYNSPVIDLALQESGEILASFEEPGTYRVDVNATDLENTWGLKVKASRGSTVVINVKNDLRGNQNDALTIANKAFELSGGLTSQDILFTLTGFDEVVINHVGILGSILAPEARINFYEGVMEGNLMAMNLEGGENTVNGVHGGQINLPVPEPGTLLMVIIGALGLIAFKSTLMRGRGLRA